MGPPPGGFHLSTGLLALRIAVGAGKQRAPQFTHGCCRSQFSTPVRIASSPSGIVT